MLKIISEILNQFKFIELNFERKLKVIDIDLLNDKQLESYILLHTDIKRLFDDFNEKMNHRRFFKYEWYTKEHFHDKNLLPIKINHLSESLYRGRIKHYRKNYLYVNNKSKSCMIKYNMTTKEIEIKVKKYKNLNIIDWTDFILK